MTTRSLLRDFRQNRGAVAAEMALVAPLLILLAFGAAELGNLFYNQHILTKAVRDGARYAARQPFAAYDMGACALSGDAETRTRRLVRTAQLASANQSSRLPNWPEADEPTTIDINVTCVAGGGYGGVYVNNANTAATVAVVANVTYTPLISSIAFDADGITLTAESEAAVAGI
jgi:Flp pilus assembly protein TadG